MTTTTDLDIDAWKKQIDDWEVHLKLTTSSGFRRLTRFLLPFFCDRGKQDGPLFGRIHIAYTYPSLHGKIFESFRKVP